MKSVKPKKDKGVSELIGTLLLIAITVILMTSLGLFLFQNVPTGQASVPRVTIDVTRDQLNYSGEYLIIVKSVTSEIPIRDISLDFTISPDSFPTIINLNSGNIYHSYPVLMKIQSVGLNGGSNAIKSFNATIQIKLYIPDNMNLTYVSIIDQSSDSIIGEGPVSGTTISCPTKNSYPWFANCLKYSSSGIPKSANSSTLDGTSYNSPAIFQSLNTAYEEFEFNSTKFNKSSLNPENEFWKIKNFVPMYPFLYDNLNINSSEYYGNGYGLSSTTNIFLKESEKVNISLCTSEPVFIRISNKTGLITPFNNKTCSSYNYSYDKIPKYYNKTLELGSGTYFIQISYFYKFQNGIIAFRLKPN